MFDNPLDEKLSQVELTVPEAESKLVVGESRPQELPIESPQQSNAEPWKTRKKQQQISIAKVDPEVQQERKVEFERLAAYIIFLQVLPWFFLYVCTPGFIMPFLRNPTALVVYGALLAWEALGLWLRYHLRPRSEFISTMQLLTLITIFITPAMLVPLLGPAIMTFIKVIYP